MSRARSVAVIMGGPSPEREISLASGQACARVLASEGFAVSPVDAGRDLAQVLAEIGPDVVFNALHGPWGEDGCTQGLLEVMGLAYTHSGVLASALAMHKARAKDVFRAAGLPVAESRAAPRAKAARAHLMEPPYVVKPMAQGSTFGVLVVPEGANAPPSELRSGSWAFGEEVMIERYVPGRELTCAVLGETPAPRALGVMEIVAPGGFYDYRAKYEDAAQHLVPAPLAPEIAAQVERIACAAHQALGCRGVSRADFRFDESQGSGGLFLLEVNTQPGMTGNSLVPELAAHAGLPFAALARWLVEDASCPR